MSPVSYYIYTYIKHVFFLYLVRSVVYLGNEHIHKYDSNTSINRPYTGMKIEHAEKGIMKYFYFFFYFLSSGQTTAYLYSRST